MQMRPYDNICGPFYPESYIPWYGIFQMKQYKAGIGIEDTVEDSFKVDLVPSRISKDLFPSRSWYTDIFTGYYRPYKEFDAINEAYKAEGFCQVQNERLRMLREIKANPDKHICFIDTKNVKHNFYYDAKSSKYYEMENGALVADENGMIYADEREMEEIMFKIDWEYSLPMKVKYNSIWKHIKHILFK